MWCARESACFADGASRVTALITASERHRRSVGQLRGSLHRIRPWEVAWAQQPCPRSDAALGS